MRPEYTLQVLHLLNLVAQRQGPRLHEVVETPIFRNLLSLLEVTNDTESMTTGLDFLIALLPSICRITNAVQLSLPAYFAVLQRAVCWRSDCPTTPTGDSQETSTSDDVSSQTSLSQKQATVLSMASALGRPACSNLTLEFRKNAAPPEISRSVNLLLRYLYHMFPWHTFRFLQEQSSTSPTFKSRLEVVFGASSLFVPLY
jgi:hypothetical protein